MEKPKDKPDNLLEPDYDGRLPSVGETAAAMLLSQRQRAALGSLYIKHISKSKSMSSLPDPHYSIEPWMQLAVPVALPQIHPNISSPILRAYAPSLYPSIPQDLFLRILDAYNLATIPSFGVEGLDAVGEILGLVPEPNVQIAGQTIGLAVEVVEEALVKARSKAFLRTVNRQIFATRGLKMEVIKGRSLGGVLGVEKLPVVSAVKEDAELNVDLLLDSGVGSFDRAIADAKHTVTNAKRKIRAIGGKVGIDDGFVDVETNADTVDTTVVTNAERRVRALGTLVADVTVDVPPPEERTKRMQRYLAKEQKKEFEKYRREQKKKRAKQVREQEENEANMAAKTEKMESRREKYFNEQQRLGNERDERIAKISTKAEERQEKRPEEAERVQKEAAKEIARVREEYTRRAEWVMKEIDEARDEFEKEMTEDEERWEEKERKKIEKLSWVVVREASAPAIGKK